VFLSIPRTRDALLTHICVCSFHLRSGSTRDSLDFKCKLCQKEHSFSDNDTRKFTKNLIVESFLNAKPSNIYRGKKFEDLKQKLASIKNQYESFSYEYEHAEENVKELCHFLRNDVQLVTESKIEELNKLSANIFSTIDDYEKNCAVNSKRTI
jgi:hypothetical protein